MERAICSISSSNSLLSGFTKKPTVACDGRSSRISSSRLSVSVAVYMDMPVALPPGLARLFASPIFVGSDAMTKTIGMVEVARLTATAATLPDATIKVGFRLTSSLASSEAYRDFLVPAGLLS